MLRKNGNGILAEMTVAAKAERVWHVLTSFEEMPAHLTGLNRSKVLREEGNYRLVEQTAKMGIPLSPLTFRVVMEIVEEKPFLYFNQRLGSFPSFSGHWRVEPSSEGDGTRVRYYLEASLGKRFGVRPVGHQMILQNLHELAAWIDNSGS